MRGDILLYASTGSLADRAIALATHGRWTHCEIDLGNGKTIGAWGNGIGVHLVDAGREHVFITPVANSQEIEYALEWAQKQVGRQYGWLDIVDNGLNLIGIQLEIGQPGTWDCSDYCTRYLIEAHADGPLGDRANNPGLVSPNDIARAYGVK